MCQSSQLCASLAFSKGGHSGLLLYQRKEGTAVAHRALDMALRLLQLLCEVGHPELAEEWITQLLLTAESVIAEVTPLHAVQTRAGGREPVCADAGTAAKRPKMVGVASAAAAALRGSSKDAAITIDSDSDEGEVATVMAVDCGDHDGEKGKAAGQRKAIMAKSEAGALAAESDAWGRWMEPETTSLCSSEEEDAEEGQIENSVPVHPWSPAVPTEARQQLIKVCVSPAPYNPVCKLAC